MRKRQFSAGLISLVALLLMVIPAKFSLAMPIADYKEKMTSNEQANFLSGGISVLTFQYADDGNRPNPSVSMTGFINPVREGRTWLLN